MQEDFPKVDLSEKKDLDHALNIVKQHAIKVIKDELGRPAKGSDDEGHKKCKEAIESWIKSAKRSLESNVTINGLSYKEASDGAEAFDKQLAQRVQLLSEQADTLTAEAIVSRKTVPAHRAALAKRQAEALDRIGKAQEAKRRKAEEAFAQTMERTVPRESLTLERSKEVAESLHDAMENMDKVSVMLLEQTSAANEQAKFVKRIRIMSSSQNQ